MGVTGARARVSDAAATLVARTRVATTLPVAVGLGVSTRDQAAEVASFADGVVVGSAFVRRLLDAHGEASGVSAVAELAGELAGGVRQARNRFAGR
jgi:tryptophan synthase alpha chain